MVEKARGDEHAINASVRGKPPPHRLAGVLLKGWIEVAECVLQRAATLTVSPFGSTFIQSFQTEGVLLGCRASVGMGGAVELAGRPVGTGGSAVGLP